MTQHERIKEYLYSFGSISALEAFRDLGIMRLGARMMELERQGLPIEHRTEYAQNRYGQKVHYTRYCLVKETA